ncbi:hypothetical protein D0862_13784, partial [Hortaea werneckii]
MGTKTKEARISTSIASEKAAQKLCYVFDYPLLCTCATALPCGLSPVYDVQSRNRQRCRRARQNCDCFPHWFEFRDAFCGVMLMILRRGKTRV